MSIKYTYNIKLPDTYHFTRMLKSVAQRKYVNLNNIIQCPFTLRLPKLERNDSMLFIAYALQKQTLDEQRQTITQLQTQLRKKTTPFKYKKYIETVNQFVREDFQIPEEWFAATKEYIDLNSISARYKECEAISNMNREDIAHLYLFNLSKYGVLTENEWYLKWWGTTDPTLTVDVDDDELSVSFTSQIIHQSFFDTWANVTGTNFICERINKNKVTATYHPIENS